jgi:hypothetical protein
MRTTLVVATTLASMVLLGPPSALGQMAEQAKTRFLGACLVSAQLDDPLGSEATRNAFCECRLEALKAAHSPAQIEAISAYIEEGNGKVVPQSTPLIGADLAANQSTEAACRAGLEEQ